MNEPTKPFRVLSLDGGGMRGLYTASVLITLAQRFSPKAELDIGKGFDLVVGTSTGGILAAGLAAGIPVTDVADVYRKHGKKIFTRPLPQNPIKKFFWGLKSFRAAANSNKPLRGALLEIFKSETIGEVYARRGIGLCLPTVNLATHESRVFKTAHDPKRNSDDSRLLADVCLASSAAPIILPLASIPNAHVNNQMSHFADGGLWANNPVLVGLIEALQVADETQRIEIFSIGTCPPPSGGALLESETRRGLMGWNFGIKALELSMDAQASGHHFMARLLVDHLQKCGRDVRLLRFEQSAPSSEQSRHLGLDNASEHACSTLVELGNSDALKAYGRSIGPECADTLIKKIFSDMPVLPAIEAS